MAAQFASAVPETDEQLDEQSPGTSTPVVPPPKSKDDLGRDDAIISKGLRRYGKLIGRYPVQWISMTFFIELVLICCGWIPRLSGDTDLTSPLSVEQQWSASGGKQEKTINTFKKHIGDKNAWGEKFSNTMFVAKNSDGDIATPEAFEEMFTLYRQYKDMKVTVKNKEYDYFDLCRRGSLVDFPPGVFPPGELPSPHPFSFLGTPKFPCIIISPFSCFREELEMTGPLWQQLEQLGMITPGAESGGLGMLDYSSRPSFRNMTAEQIKETLSAIIEPNNMPNLGQSAGCLGYINELKYYVNAWGGMVEWNKNKSMLKKVGGVRALLFMDGAGRVAYRMSETKPDHAVVEDIEEAEKLMTDEWHKFVENYRKTTKHVDVVNMKDWYYVVKQIDEEFTQMQWSYFLIGGALMMLYCLFALVSYRHPMASRANLGFTGLFMVLIAETTAFATFFIFGLYLNAPMLVGLPLLALGLGLDDMFVLIRYFSNLGVAFISEKRMEADDIIGEVLAQAGPGTTLTSLCNILTFGVGMFLPIPAMSDFCIGAALVAFFNYFTMINLFMPIFVMEISRIKNTQPDPHIFTFYCHKKILEKDADQPEMQRRQSIKATSAEDFSGGLEKAFVNFLKKIYAPLVMKWFVRYIATPIIVVGVLVLTFYFIITKELGYSPQDLFDGRLHETGSMERLGMELSFTSFSLFPAMLMFDGLDVASNQQEMLQVYKDIVASDWHEQYLFPPYPTMMTVAGYSAYNTYPGIPLCSIPPDMLPPPPGPSTTDSNGTNKNRRLTSVPGIACDTSWRDPIYAPLGLVPANTFNQTFTDWRTLPSSKFGKMDGWTKLGWYYADVVDVNQFVYNSRGEITLSFFQFFQVFPYEKGRNNELVFVESINHMRDVIDKSPIKDYVSVYGDIVNFWEVFLDLDRYLHMLIGVGAAIIFVVTLFIFSMDFVVAFITAFSCAMIVLEVYGISSALLNFNVFIAAFTLMGMGMAVEFTAHFAAAFSISSGTPEERMGLAMAHTFPAIIEGSCSTLLGIVPLAFHEAQFVLKYLFIVIAMVVGIGCFNGFFVMPGLVGLLSPVIKCVDESIKGSSPPVTEDLEKMK